MDYKERIRALREDNDYTQSRIAGLLNIGQNTPMLIMNLAKHESL